MKQTKLLCVLINAFDNACQVLNIDRNTQNLLGRYKLNQFNLEQDGDEASQYNQTIEVLTAFVNFYCVLHRFSGGRYRFYGSLVKRNQ